MAGDVNVAGALDGPALGLPVVAWPLPQGHDVDRGGDAVVVTLRHVPSDYERVVKRVLDVIGALLLLLLTLPIMLLTALVIRTFLGPGVIFRQTRVGQDGRLFSIYKFRTMEPDRRVTQLATVDTDRRMCHKRDDDPRHTRIGRVLRRWSLDELAQVWNVLKGDMSLVGPRPELPEVVERYEPWQHLRHQLRPGVTGLWQVSDRAGGLACDGVGYDMEYLRSISFLTDCRILLRTLPAVVRRTGQ